MRLGSEARRARRRVVAVVALLGACLTSCASPPPPRARPAVTKRTQVARKPPPPQVERELVENVQPDPEAQRLFRAKIDQPAMTLAQPATLPKVAALALANSALDHTSGMKPDPAIDMATLTEGQRASMRVTIEPTECATFVAQGGIGAIELDLFLTAERGENLRVLAQDTSIGPIAAIGGRGRCFRSGLDTPLTAELHVTLRRGAGAVLVRRYRATKGAQAPGPR